MFRPRGVIIRLASMGSKYVAERIILYKAVFDSCLFIPYFIAQHNGMHNFKIRDFNLLCQTVSVFSHMDS
jgi:hypothetical protein